MKKRSDGGITRLSNAFRWSLAGLAATFKHEKSFRQELILAVILFPLALWLGKTGTEKALLIGPILLVVIAELINSAIETVVDRIGDEIHPLSGRAKDIGSAAVLLAMVNLVIVWALVLFF
ncbi:MAG: diacylglycerol kinase [Desulfobulbaceae bacterium]|nr:MAG: diacylglycerol kinase [Desulfobulbaceae bacterium]